MTTMEKFFDTMKDNAKYAVVAASLTSMLVTGFPGAAQAQSDFSAKARPTEIAQVEATYIAGKEMQRFGESVNVLVKADIELRDMLMKLENAHWRLQDKPMGEASVEWVLNNMQAKDIDLTAAKDIVAQMKKETGVDFVGIVNNMEQQLAIAGKMEEGLHKISDVYNAKGYNAAKELHSQHESLAKEAWELYRSPSMTFLRPASFKRDTRYAREIKKDGDLGKLGEIERSIGVSMGRLEAAILSMNRRPDRTHSHESLLTDHQEYTAAKDIPLEQVREIAARIEESGIDMSEVAQNIEQRAEIIGRMETRLDAIIKDYYTNDGAGMSKNIALYDMESMEYTRLASDASLSAIRPEIKESAASTSSHRSHGHSSRGLSYGRTHMLIRRLR